MKVPSWRTAARPARKSPAKTAAQRDNKANAEVATGRFFKRPKRARLKKSDVNILEKARQKTPTPKSSRPNNMIGLYEWIGGVTQGGIPAKKAPTQANVGRKFSEGGSVSRTGHTDYRKKGMFK